MNTVYPKKYAHGFCFAVLCCGYTLTDFPISIRLTSLALWQSDDCPSASKATLMNMDKYFIWIHYERLHNHNKAKHKKTVCIFLGIYCIYIYMQAQIHIGINIVYRVYFCNKGFCCSLQKRFLKQVWVRFVKIFIPQFRAHGKFWKVGGRGWVDGGWGRWLSGGGVTGDHVDSSFKGGQVMPTAFDVWLP